MKDADLTVRVISEDDLPALVEIDAKSGGAPRTDYLQEKVVRALDSSAAIALVAESEGRVVGFMMGQVTKGEFGVSEPVVTVDTVAIHPELRGRGTGRRLMGELLLRAKRAGAARVRTIVDWDQWELMGFFRTLGFAPGTGVVLQRRV